MLALAAGVMPLLGGLPASGSDALPPIDRHALVARHFPVLHEFDPTNPFTVGNGDFAFTADVTGLQTFFDAYTNTIPLGTLSQWGWHTSPNPEGWSMDTFQYKEYNAGGRMVPYADTAGDHPARETQWLRSNPHRLHLGQIGFVLTRTNGAPARPQDLTGIEQTLDLWDGLLHSRFQFEGQPVEVFTVCHPDREILAVRGVSPLLRNGGVRIQLHFPYGTGSTVTADWAHPAAHQTLLTMTSPHTAQFTRRLDWDRYAVSARWSNGGRMVERAPHLFVLSAPEGADQLELECGFAPEPMARARCRTSREPARWLGCIGINSGPGVVPSTCH